MVFKDKTRPLVHKLLSNQPSQGTDDVIFIFILTFCSFGVIYSVIFILTWSLVMIRAPCRVPNNYLQSSGRTLAVLVRVRFKVKVKVKVSVGTRARARVRVRA